MRLYKSLGGHAITASIVEEAWGGQTYGGNNSIHYPSMIKWIKSDSGEWKFDFTQFDKWVQLNKQIASHTAKHATLKKQICTFRSPSEHIFLRVSSGSLFHSFIPTFLS